MDERKVINDPNDWATEFLRRVQDKFADNNERRVFRGYLDKYNIRSENAEDFLNAYQAGPGVMMDYLKTLQSPPDPSNQPEPKKTDIDSDSQFRGEMRHAA